jgi:purine-cytosine permease-like protein
MVRRLRAPDLFRDRVGSGRMHVPNPPSIDPGVMAFVWALLLALYVYFGLLAIDASAAFAIVVALLSFAGIWLFVRLRGEDRPGA